MPEMGENVLTAVAGQDIGQDIWMAWMAYQRTCAKWALTSMVM